MTTRGTNDPLLWAIEYSDKQEQFHIQPVATIQDAGADWRRIGEVYGTAADAHKFCDEWDDKQEAQR